MLISGTNLKNAMEQYRKSKNIQEGYNVADVAGAGMSAAMASFVLVIAVLFFMLELMVLFYSITIALNCTESTPERVVHIVLAITFTLPYALLNVLFNKCAISTLRSSNGWLPVNPAKPVVV